MRPAMIAVVFVLVFVVLIAAVAWTLMSYAPPAGQPQGTVSLYVMDAPANQTWVHVNVTFDRVEVHQNGSDWRNLTLVSKGTVDLIPLVNNLSALLAKADVPVSNYTQVRFHVSAVVGTLKVGSGPCTTPGNAACTVYMSVPSTDLLVNRAFDVNGSKTTTLVLGIDLSRSIVPAGATWIFAPVLDAVVVVGPK